MREKKTLAWASVSHFFIDFLCAWLITHQLIENGSWFFLLFLYNFLAFAAQLPLGILLDALCAQRMAGRAGAMGRLLQDNARLITAGTGCLFCGAALLPGIGHLPLVLLCGAGNAMFHVGTGSDLLEKSEGKAWPSGLFVSTGAVGIFAGALVPLSEGGRILAGCILILLCALLFLVCRRCHGTGMRGNSAEHAAVLPRDRGGLTGGFFLPAACLVLVVVLRSFDGLLFSFDWNDGQRTGVLLTCMIFLGKCLGGFAADWMGSLWASVCSLGAAAVLLAFSGFPAAGLSGVLFFNMTMPVTLYELYRRLPGNSGASFGLLTFALYLGFLPVYTGMTEGMRHPLYYSVFALISLFLLAYALRKRPGRKTVD